MIRLPPVLLLLSGCPALDDAVREDPPSLDPPPSAVEPEAPAPAPIRPPPAPVSPDAKPIQAEVEVAEGEGAEAVRQVVRKGQGQVRSCYERTLRENPDAKGRIVLSVTIVVGRVTQVSVAEDTVGDPTLTGCIRRVVQRWRFDEAVNETATLPFSLQSQ